MEAQMNNASLIPCAIKNIRPNPFRNSQRYPIRREKVDALRESLRATEYWPNIVARRIDGGAEIAYGHHRIEAARQEYGVDYEISLVIRDLSDETMFQMMARENREVTNSSASNRRHGALT
jgi:ParB-like chromosome segregation protein Spo0J